VTVAVRLVAWPSVVGLSLVAFNPATGTSVMVTGVVAVSALALLLAVTTAV
jgi:hypothetical protein